MLTKSYDKSIWHIQAFLGHIFFFYCNFWWYWILMWYHMNSFVKGNEFQSVYLRDQQLPIWPSLLVSNWDSCKHMIHVHVFDLTNDSLLYPHSMKLEGGYTGIRLCICLSAHLWTQPSYRSPGCNSSSPIAVKLYRDLPWVKISDEFVHGRRGLLNECLTS